jgi:cobalt transporter subunit CbtA
MLQRILTCALLSGLATGILMTALHAVLTVPLILHAELYEDAARTKPAASNVKEPVQSTGHVHQPVGQEAHADHSTLKGMQRFALTLLSTIVSTIGFALMLTAVAVVAYGEINILSGFGFGLAGFAATGLATSLGLAPELPGSAAADLIMRQGWWIATAVATAAGLAVIIFSDRPVFKLFGLVLIIGPHVFGAPGFETASSRVPAELSALFAARSLVLQGVMWVVLGLMSGWIWQRQARRLGDPIPA